MILHLFKQFLELLPRVKQAIATSLIEFCTIESDCASGHFSKLYV